MDVLERLPWAQERIAVAHVGGELPAALRAPAVPGGLERPGMPASLLAELCSELDSDAQAPWRALSDPQARVVVTGQQPGCVGGVLLVLYKAATAVALARRCRRALGVPVVPVYWNATDDVDFDEIARVAWPDASGQLLFLELPRRERRSQALVGDIAAGGDTAASRAVLEMLDGSARATLERLLPERAADHGDWVARFLRAVFPDLAVLDARSAALRRHAAPLFGRYLDRHRDAARLLEERAEALVAAGFERALSPASTRMALFLTRDGQRHKVQGDIEALRRELDSAPENVAPSVVLRPLVQDSLLPVIAAVVGPAEIAYLLELRGLRAALDVPEPALVPRLSQTLVGRSGWETGRRLGIPVARLLADDDRVLREVARRRGESSLRQVSAAFEALDDGLRPLSENSTSSAVKRVLQRARALRADLERAVEDAALRGLLAEEPELARMQTVIRPRGRPQERLVAALWLVARWGGEAGPRLIRLAETHLDALERGDLEHSIVVD